MWRPAQIISDRTHDLAEPVGRLVGKTRVHPNTLTIFGFLLNFGVAWLLSQGYFLYGGLLILAAGIFDLLDGAVARVMGKVTKFGALLDSTLDRYSEAVILFGLLWYYTWQPDAYTEVILIFTTIIASLLVSYVRARAEGLNLDAEVGSLTPGKQADVVHQLYSGTQTGVRLVKGTEEAATAGKRRVNRYRIRCRYRYPR